MHLGRECCTGAERSRNERDSVSAPAPPAGDGHRPHDRSVRRGRVLPRASVPITVPLMSAFRPLCVSGGCLLCWPAAPCDPPYKGEPTHATPGETPNVLNRARNRSALLEGEGNHVPGRAALHRAHTGAGVCTSAGS